MLNRKLIKKLKKTINNLEEELELEKSSNRLFRNDCLILLETSINQRRKIKDLENNIEFLVNNLSAKKRELVRPLNQN